MIDSLDFEFKRISFENKMALFFISKSGQKHKDNKKTKKLCIN
jgi:hypothetical protein